MNIRVVAAVAILLTGCPGGPDPRQPPDIDLSQARRLESDGKLLDAIIEHARHVDELTRSGRADVRAHVAWGRIFRSLTRLKFREQLSTAPADVRKKCEPLSPWLSASGAAFLSAGEAGHWTQVLCGGAEPAVLAEAASAVADLLAEKLDNPSLRRGRIEPAGTISEHLYRRALAEAASDYAGYALCRLPTKGTDAVARAVELLRRLGKEYRDLAALPGVLTEPAARWAERSAQAEAAVLALKADPGGATLTNDLRQAVERDAKALLDTAIESTNKANDLLSRRADEVAILDALEGALRNFAAGRECLVEPSPNQKRTLNVMPIAADALRSLAFER